MLGSFAPCRLPKQAAEAISEGHGQRFMGSPATPVYLITHVFLMLEVSAMAAGPSEAGPGFWQHQSVFETKQSTDELFRVFSVCIWFLRGGVNLRILQGLP